jgi:hypothetical protein
VEAQVHPIEEFDVRLQPERFGDRMEQERSASAVTH